MAIQEMMQAVLFFFDVFFLLLCFGASFFSLFRYTAHRMVQLLETIHVASFPILISTLMTSCCWVTTVADQNRSSVLPSLRNSKMVMSSWLEYWQYHVLLGKEVLRWLTPTPSNVSVLCWSSICTLRPCPLAFSSAIRLW